MLATPRTTNTQIQQQPAWLVPDGLLLPVAVAIE